MATIGMFNEEGENVDLYIPRKCHATNTLIEAHDHAAVQISIANVGPNGGAAAGAAAQKGGRPSVQKGARPASQKGARPPTQKGARPPTQKGARPPAQKGAAPARKNRA
ncbi:Ribosomal protein S21e family protein [Leishmania donovani]|uniref:Ribosomal protein S21e family protein n=1 Tax=Leishmania donovani TaxID=5661 RepID=A0A504XWQ8_LEIDO|nr:Ribosomal protein S21e family protein [Leishmania donovani]